MNKEYYKHFKEFIPNYRKQYFIAKMQNDIKAMVEIKDNIWKNWNLTETQKKEVFKEIGIK